MASARVVDDVVEIVRHVARDLTGADGASFVLRDGDQCFYVDEDAVGPLWRGQRFPMETCISGWSMLNRQTVAIRDIYRDDRIPHDAYRPTFVKSLVMVPIRTHEPIGAIGNYWAQEHVASPAEIEVLQALADSTAVALENVRLLAELEARVEERTAQLAEANADLQHLAAIAAHDMKGPLATVRGYLELMERTYGDQLGADGMAMLGAMERGLEGTIDLVGDLLDYARSGSLDPAKAWVSLDERMAIAVDRLAGTLRERGADVVSDDPLPEVLADGNLVTPLLQNLIGNAVVYAPEGIVPRVEIAATPLGDRWELTVSDNGAGIPDDEKERILRPFERGSSANGRMGTGLGLAICRRVAERHGWSIEVRDADHGGAAIVVTIPGASVRAAAPPVAADRHPV